MIASSASTGALLAKATAVQGPGVGRPTQVFPRCPADRETIIAEHACQKYSGRSAAAKALDEQAVRLAVIAHVRHAKTDYDVLLAQGHERSEARAQVHEAIARVLARREASDDMQKIGIAIHGVNHTDSPPWRADSRIASVTA